MSEASPLRWQTGRFPWTPCDPCPNSATSNAACQGWRFRARVLRLEGGSCPPVPRSEQCDRAVARQKGGSTVYFSFFWGGQKADMLVITGVVFRGTTDQWEIAAWPPRDDIPTCDSRRRGVATVGWLWSLPVCLGTRGSLERDSRCQNLLWLRRPGRLKAANRGQPAISLAHESWGSPEPSTACPADTSA